MSHPLWWSAILAAVVVLIGALWQLRLYLQIGAGYKAKVLCTAIFGSRRDLDPRRADQVSADSYWLLRALRTEIDRGAGHVTVSLAGAVPRRAVHREGAGATLLSHRRSPAPVFLGPLVKGVSDGWVTAATPSRLSRVVRAAFDEPHPRRLRRTFAILVVHDGRVVAEQYAAGITADMPLPGWSMAKSVLNALVGILVDQDRLGLADDQLLAQWKAPDPRGVITLEDLLRMRSGLRFSELYSNPRSNVLRMLYRSDDTAAYAAGLPLADRPGAVWNYASGTSNILSRIVRETVGDDHYHQWPRRVLFDRLGMRSAVIEADATGTFVCSSYLLATARDWARYGQLWADGGRHAGAELLSREWVQFSTTPTSQSPDGCYGAHWWLRLNPEMGGATAAAGAIAPDAFFAVGHEAQTLTVIPSKRLVIVRLGASIYIDAWDQASFVSAVQDALDDA